MQVIKFISTDVGGKFTDALTLGPDQLGRTISYTVGNNPFIYELAKLDNTGKPVWSGIEIPSNAIQGAGFTGPPYPAGIRFKSVAPGTANQAVVAAVLWDSNDPTPLGGITLTDILSASGGLTPGGNLVASIASAHGSIGTNVASGGAGTAQTIDSLDINLDSYVLVGNQIQVPRTGYYRATAFGAYPANAAGEREIHLQRFNHAGALISDVILTSLPGTAAAAQYMVVSQVIPMNTGEGIGTLLFQNSGGALVVLPGSASAPNLTVSYEGS